MRRPALRCPVCGQDRAPSCPNRWCRRAERGFSVVFAAGVHDRGLRGAIVRYKFGGERRLAGPLSSVLASFVDDHAAWFEEFDAMTAVPAFRGSGARRPWDPLALLLQQLSSRLPSWWVEPGLVAKRCETPAMTGRPWSERQDIARGPLRASLVVPRPSAVAGRQILVVDDVFAEGSTMCEVARALRLAGASDVAGLVLARPPWSPDPPGRSVWFKP